jgi:two-component system, LuxR family, response regulator FixJ
MTSVVYLIDDHDAFRESTVWLLEAADFTVRSFASGSAFLDQYSPRTERACIVSDVRMPGMSGLELLAESKRKGIALPFLFITGHGDVPLAVEAMRCGASNFIEKPFTEEAITQAIEVALTDTMSMQSVNADRTFGGKTTAQPAEEPEILSKLSARERQVLDLVVAGKPNKIISRELDISIKTVELHRAHMMSKLAVKTVQDLMRVVLSRP